MGKSTGLKQGTQSMYSFIQFVCPLLQAWQLRLRGTFPGTCLETHVWLAAMTPLAGKQRAHMVRKVLSTWCLQTLDSFLSPFFSSKHSCFFCTTWTQEEKPVKIKRPTHMYPECFSNISQMSFSFQVLTLLKLLRKLLELFLKLPNNDLRVVH